MQIKTTINSNLEILTLALKVSNTIHLPSYLLWYSAPLWPQDTGKLMTLGWNLGCDKLRGSPNMLKTRKQQSLCVTSQIWMRSCFSPLPLSHTRNGSRPISSLQDRLVPAAAPALPSSVYRFLVLWPFTSEAEKLYMVSYWNGCSHSTPAHGGFALRSTSAWHQQ